MKAEQRLLVLVGLMLYHLAVILVIARDVGRTTVVEVADVTTSVRIGTNQHDRISIILNFAFFCIVNLSVISVFGSIVANR
jgi:hypothetical protein